MREGNYYLRVKIKSLVDESATIKKEADRVRKRLNGAPEDSKVQLRMNHVLRSLDKHDKSVVKRELRSTLLALAAIRGRKYAEVEHFTRSSPDFGRIKKLIARYYAKDYGKTGYFSPKRKVWEKEAEAWAEAWIQEAKDHLYLSGGGDGAGHLKAKDAAEGREEREKLLQEARTKLASLGEGLSLWPENRDGGRNSSAYFSPVSLVPKQAPAPEGKPEEKRKKLFGIL